MLDININSPPNYRELKNRSCIGCEHMSSKKCGQIEPKNYNGGLVWRKKPDEKCEKGYGYGARVCQEVL